MTANMSAFGQLLGMLASPVIKRSSVLTDKLLRLLSLISLGQPESTRTAAMSLAASSTANTTIVAPTAVLSTAAASSASASGSNVDEADKPGPSSVQKQQEPQPVERTVSSDQIKLAVEVLTSKACSEEGLEDVTALLLNLSYVGTQTRESILSLLLEGARQLGQVVSDNVSTLLKELRDLKTSGVLTLVNTKEATTTQDDDDNKQKGVLADRFTKEAVVLTAPTKPKAGGELQLSSMSALTSKTSSQSFFLRVLKVIIQLREAALHAMQKSMKAKKDEWVLAAAKKAAAAVLREGSESDSAATATAPGSSSMEEGATSTASTTTVAGTTTSSDTRTADTTPSLADSGTSISNTSTDDTSNAEATTNASASEAGGGETPMEIDDTSSSSDNNLNTDVPPLIDIPPDNKSTKPSTSKDPKEEECFLESLSDQLDLSQLWQTLSSCLRELADTPDHHAVLVLQPTVEAFFLVHAAATTNTEKKKTNQKETRQEQLAHIQVNKYRFHTKNLVFTSKYGFTDP